MPTLSLALYLVGAGVGEPYGAGDIRACGAREGQSADWREAERGAESGGRGVDSVSIKKPTTARR